MNTSFWLLSIGVSLDFESAWDCCMPRCYMLPMYFVINSKMSFHTLITLTLLWCFLPSINYLLIWTTVDSRSYTWFKTVLPVLLFSHHHACHSTNDQKFKMFGAVLGIWFVSQLYWAKYARFVFHFPSNESISIWYYTVVNSLIVWSQYLCLSLHHKKSRHLKMVVIRYILNSQSLSLEESYLNSDEPLLILSACKGNIFERLGPSKAAISRQQVIDMDLLLPRIHDQQVHM